MNFRKINLWLNKAFCQNFLIDGLISLKFVYFNFLYVEKLENEIEINVSILIKSESLDEADILDKLLKDDDSLKLSNKESEKCKIEIELNKEVKLLTDILSNSELINGIK